MSKELTAPQENNSEASEARGSAEKTPVLSAERVHEIWAECWAGEESEGEIIEVDAIEATVRLKKGSLDQYKAEIAAMLDELPAEFRADGGGGWSFVQGAIDKHGRQWAEQMTVLKLFVLGMATGKVTYFADNRELWKAFYAGVPYYVIH